MIYLNVYFVELILLKVKIASGIMDIMTFNNNGYSIVNGAISDVFQ